MTTATGGVPDSRVPDSGVPDGGVPDGAGEITVRYWAGVRAAAGVDTDRLAVDGVVRLAEVLDRVRALHADTRFGGVLATCSLLVGDRPVGSHDPGQVEVRPGEAVEVLPPFAGG
ncbi:MAG: MoaD/ThiS family protein [Marmoricola sp.]